MIINIINETVYTNELSWQIVENVPKQRFAKSIRAIGPENLIRKRAPRLYRYRKTVSRGDRDSGGDTNDITEKPRARAALNKGSATNLSLAPSIYTYTASAGRTRRPRRRGQCCSISAARKKARTPYRGAAIAALSVFGASRAFYKRRLPPRECSAPRRMPAAANRSIKRPAFHYVRVYV